MELSEMNMRDRERVRVIQDFQNREISREEAAFPLRISERQVSRISKRYSELENAGIVRKTQQKKEPQGYSSEFKQSVLDIVATHYGDFGPTLISEKLLERHHLNLSRETIRKWLIAANQSKLKRKKRKSQHSLRARRERFGELIQIDGSLHHWFEDRAPQCTLLVVIDDATGQLLHLEFAPSESRTSYAAAFNKYLQKYGKPRSIYSDKHSVFSVNNKGLNEHHDRETELAKSLRMLGIQPILAHSPQAKGRVERANATLQDRLVKELRLENISTIEEANIFAESYRHTWNRRFAVQPEAPEDSHISLTSEEQLELPFILSHKTHRKVSKSLTVQCDNRVYQLLDQGAGRRIQGSGVVVCYCLDGSVQICSADGKILPFEEFTLSLHRPPTLDSKELETYHHKSLTPIINRDAWKDCHTFMLQIRMDGTFLDCANTKTINHI